MIVSLGKYVSLIDFIPFCSGPLFPHFVCFVLYLKACLFTEIENAYVCPFVYESTFPPRFLAWKRVIDCLVWSLLKSLLIHEADPQTWPVVVTIFACVVCSSLPTFQNLAKQNKIQARIVIANGGIVDLPSGSLMAHMSFFSSFLLFSTEVWSSLLKPQGISSLTV